MAESTYTLTYSDVRIAVGYDRRFGADPTAWSASNTDVVDRSMKIGGPRFYFPGSVTLPDGRTIVGFEWSFMSPTATVYLWPTYEAASTRLLSTNGTAVTAGTGTTFYSTMVGKTITITAVDYVVASYTSATSITLATSAGVQNNVQWSMTANGDYRMPDDFGGIRDRRITTGANSLFTADYVNEELIRQARAMSPNLTGYPTNFSITPVRTTGTTAQRFDMMVVPTPSQLTTLAVPYTYLPDALTSTLIYHAGGMPYSNAFRLACMAAAESIVDDTAGLREQEFQAALGVAAAYDMRHRPRVIGQSQDNTGNLQAYGNSFWPMVGTTTFTP